MQTTDWFFNYSSRVISVPALLLAAAALAQTPPVPLVKEGVTVKISEHVHVIPDANVPLVPNIGFIVGTKATLVVDTGMGRRNGETVMRELAKVSRNAEWYVTTTHFHPEHTMGTFAAGTQFVYPRAQQQDIDEFGTGMVDTFKKRSPEIAALLSDARYPHADRIFDREQTLDLGGVHVRLMWLGPTHTRGDTAIFVEEDRVLFAGDLAMKRAFPAFASPYSSGRTWLASLDALDALRPVKVVGSHGEMGDAALISDYRGYLKTVEARVQQLKAAGVPVAEAEKTLTAELQARYPDWAQPARIAGAVQAFYADR
jgi:glyoxylase-like metal-dependent hydrolase (beta-lactamase superfamily II)